MYDYYTYLGLAANIEAFIEIQYPNNPSMNGALCTLASVNHLLTDAWTPDLDAADVLKEILDENMNHVSDAITTLQQAIPHDSSNLNIKNKLNDLREQYVRASMTIGGETTDIRVMWADSGLSSI